VKEGLDINLDRWPDVSRVFTAAAPLDGPSRHAYLDEACGHDAALRAAVESLLGAHDNAGSFGEAPVVAPLGTVTRLAPGSQLGPFRIESWIGAGGMGEVYRATDTKLQRAVAIKVLPDSFAQDPNRLARFEDEARALAALNHPNIGSIYGLEESAGIVALVLELVEGPTLAERLAAGPLSFDEVVRIARQLAEGLEAAHEHGIVHRDLKPANIKITPDGSVKILDFGLAKTTVGSPPGAALTPSTTSPRSATQFGVILGTVGYMSPEQARGEAVDKRTDIWAFGCVLFEMCAHQPPFAGATITDAQAAVIEREPEWKLLRAGTPPNLIRLLRRCLTKDLKLRLRDIGEARIALEQDTDTANVAPRSTTRRVAAIAAILATAASFAIAFALFGWPRSGPSVSSAPTRFDVLPGDGIEFFVQGRRTFFALSPDGLQLAFAARRGIWVRAVSNPDARLLPGTDGASSIFWSPDGQSLAFASRQEWKRVNLRDHAVARICRNEGGVWSHGTWGDADVILLGRSDGRSIDAVPAGGGEPVQILSINQSKGEALVHWPWFLPGGKRFLYTASLDDGDGEVRLAQLRPNDREGKEGPVQLEEGARVVVSANSNAQWVPPDVVVFAREGVLMARRVDVEKAGPLASPFPIAAPVGSYPNPPLVRFSVSLTGSVASHSAVNVNQLVWADGNGNEVGTISRPDDYESGSVRLSRDDSALLVARRRADLGTLDIWRVNLHNTIEDQLTLSPGNEMNPVWTRDARAILFSGDTPGSPVQLFRQDLATGLAERILRPGYVQRAMDVFSDGRVIYWENLTGKIGGSLMFQVPLAGGASPTQLLSDPLSEGFHMRLSPDERLMTFQTPRADGTHRIFVVPAPLSGAPVTSAPVFVGDGLVGPAVWKRDGSQIYYVSPDRTMMTRAVLAGPPLTLGRPERLFKLKPGASFWDVSGKDRFLLHVYKLRSGQHPIAVWIGAIASQR
jgi:serine/threonine protein kinase/Tol biopolymer transport system component